MVLRPCLPQPCCPREFEINRARQWETSERPQDGPIDYDSSCNIKDVRLPHARESPPSAPFVIATAARLGRAADVGEMDVASVLVPDCVKLTPAAVRALKWLPVTCA